MLHEWLLFVHIVGAIVFVGGGITLGVQVLGARRAPRQFLDAAKLAGRAIGVGAVLTLLSGIALVFVESDVWSFSMGFVLFGIATIVISGAVDALYFRKQTSAIEVAIEEGGPESPEVHAGLLRLARANAIVILLYVATVWAMVFKPGV